MGKLGDELQDLIDRKHYPAREKPTVWSIIAFLAFILGFGLLMQWVFH